MRLDHLLSKRKSRGCFTVQLSASFQESRKAASFLEKQESKLIGWEASANQPQRLSKKQESKFIDWKRINQSTAASFLKKQESKFIDWKSINQWTAEEFRKRILPAKEKLIKKDFWWWCVSGTHPFSSRTRWLRPRRPMVLYWRRYGRVGGCQNKIYGLIAQLVRAHAW